MSYYFCRIGEGSKYTAEAIKNGFIAIGWNQVPDLKTLKTSDNIRAALTGPSSEYSQGQVGAYTGQLHRFGFEMQSGDYALVPLGSGEYRMAIIGEYYFEANPPDTCPYKHRRQVEWLKRRFLKEDMSTNLSYSIGALLTVFSIDKYADELKALMEGKEHSPAEKPQRVRDVILEGLMGLDGKGFEEFTRHLLEVIGFTAQTTQYVGDKGIDVNGILDAEGLAEITLRVQAKRIRGSIGNKEVLALRGALAQGEHGCLITTSTFTSAANEEAQASGKVGIKLIDRNDLAGLILLHFDDIDDKYRTRFGIRKRKDFNIEDQFEPVISQESIEDTETVTRNTSVEWDTLVCPGNEDGFRSAFLGEKAWWAVRLSKQTMGNIKYLAIYQTAPVSAITVYDKVISIEPHGDSGKYRLNLEGKPSKLEKPVGIGMNPHLKPQAPRYAKLEKILNAKTLDDVFK